MWRQLCVDINVVVTLTLLWLESGVCATDGEQCACSWHCADACNWDNCGSIWNAQREGLYITVISSLLAKDNKVSNVLNRNSLLPSVLFITCLVLFVKFSCLFITINERSDTVCFVDNELEVGDCRKEDFCCKLSRASQVWHGMSSHHFV